MSESISQTKVPQDEFEVLQQLGEGSYGKVFKALNRSTARIVALKVVAIESDDKEMMELTKEIHILEKCSSPFIVQYYGSILYENNLWIEMEFCEAGSVSDMLRVSQTVLTEKEVAAVCANVVKGLTYLHHHRNIHRDIKAGNILLSASGLAKLADFGVSAQLTNTINKRKTVIGTPFWMAPEVIQETQYDGKADIWSLGITAIEMAEGDPPLSKMHPMRAIFMIPSRPPPTLADPSRYSPQFVDFLAICLKKDATQRPTAEALLAHPFLKKDVDKLENLLPGGLPALQELVDRNLDALGQDREGSPIDIQDAIHVEESTSGSNSSTMIHEPNADDDDSGSGSYGTMVFRGNTSKEIASGSRDTTELYGTVVQRGSLEAPPEKTVTKKSSEPSFMKYFRMGSGGDASHASAINAQHAKDSTIRPGSATGDDVKSITQELLRLETQYNADRAALEKAYLIEKQRLEAHLESHVQVLPAM
ncbi:Aste57867_12969 [Aphanomyces stellatus]|uniref:non-specific serine/threonine protein kinase n=1 Tax=Aphanomyces stellatus TaxID=120398 RepID=A0A485KWZ4_9STRA|nr:hypothetical protein As57867_012921 [Aphanomyces stellatus]VFT89815.1 Aste57867_12969 [Aphanomyces stellatus]